MPLLDRRVAQYENTDGAADLAFGVWFLMFALLNRLSGAVSAVWGFLAVAYGLIAATWALTHFGTRLIRRRLVYRRAGYIEMRRRLWARVLTAILAGTVSAGIVFAAANLPVSSVSWPFAMGTVIGLAMLIAALLHRIWKYTAFGVVSIGIGLVLQFLEPTLVRGTFCYFLSMGATLVLAGALTLYLYVRRTPVRQPEDE